MKLLYYWQLQSGELIPLCNSDIAMHENTSLLECLILDDGGLSLSSTIQSVEEGIKLVRYVLSGNSSENYWDREAWGASFDIENTQIYSLHDDSYTSTVKTKDFLTALELWYSLLSNPKPQLRIELLL